MPRDDIENKLRDLLRKVLDARFDGSQYADFTRAHGYADGYMRALLDAGAMDNKDLLRVVGSERRKHGDS